MENIDSTLTDKNDEKSRVIISQEETEDAVAALLGESFDMSATDYSFTEEPIAEEVSNLPTSDNMIAEEEAEEMRKAVQSLNTEEIDMKPDTPQSDNGLQIDTDTEEPDDSNALQIDESVRTDENKSPVKDTKKSPLKNVTENSKLSSNECKRGTGKPENIQDVNKKVEHKVQTSKVSDDNESHKASIAPAPIIIGTKAKPQIEPPILPPIIPKMASIDTPTDLLSVSISTPTLTNKPNIIHMTNLSSEKSTTTTTTSTTKPTTTSEYSIHHTISNPIKMHLLKIKFHLYNLFPHRYDYSSYANVNYSSTAHIGYTKYSKSNFESRCSTTN